MLSLVKSSPLFQGKLLGKPVSGNVFSIDIHDIELPVRMWNFLNDTGIQFLSDLLNLDPLDLYDIRNIGLKTIENTRMAIIEGLNKEHKDSNKGMPSQDGSTGTSNENAVLTYLRDSPMLKEQLRLKIRKSPQSFSNFLGKSIDVSLDINEISPFLPERLIQFIRNNSCIRTIMDLLEKDHTPLFWQLRIGKKAMQDACYTLKEISDHPELFSISYAKDRGNNVLSKYVAILLFIFERADDRTKQILTKRFEQYQTLTEIGKELGLTRERIRQLVDKFLRSIKLRISPLEKQLKEEIIKIILNCPEPLDNQLFVKFDSQPKNMFLATLVELYPVIPTVRNQTSYQEQRRTQLHGKTNEKLEALVNIYEAYTPRKLVTALGLSQRDEILSLFGMIFGSNKYFFRERGGIYFLYKKDSLNEMAKAILRQAKEPMTIDDIMDVIRRNYDMIYNNGSYSAIVSRLKQDREIFQLDRSLFGMAKHLSYQMDLWPNIGQIAAEFLKRENRQVNIIEIMEQVTKQYPSVRSKYELVYIIRNHKEVFDLGFFNFCHVDLNLQERIKISTLIERIFTQEQRVLNAEEIYRHVRKERFARLEGMNSLLASQDYLKDYGNGFFGLYKDHEKNLGQLATDSNYLERRITNAVYPYTTFARIFEELLDLDSSTVRDTIMNSRQFVILGDYESDEQWILVRRWPVHRMIFCILCNGGNPMFKDEMNWYLRKADRVLEDAHPSPLSNLGIVDAGDKVELRQLSVSEGDGDETMEAAFQYLINQRKTVSLDELLCHLNQLSETGNLSIEELRYLVENDARFVLGTNEMVMLYE